MKTTVISAGWSQLGIGSKIAEHSHICYQLYYITQGSPVFVVNGEKFPVQPGSFFYIPPQMPHRMLPLQGSPMSALDIKIQCSDPFLSSHLEKPSQPFQDSGYVRNMLDYIYTNWNCKDHQNLENIDAILTALLMNFFLHELHYDHADSCRIKTDPYNALSKAVMAYIENNYQKKFSLQYLSSALGFNPNYLSSAFVKNTGISIIEYLNLIRIRHAVIMIAFFLQDIFTTYESVGFSNASHFSRTFKALVGASARNVRYAFSRGDRQALDYLFAHEPILNFQVCTLEETYASLRSIGEAVNRLVPGGSTP